MPGSAAPQATAPTVEVDNPSGTDVRPVLERRSDSIWAEAERQRDKIYAALQEVCRERGFNAALLKSNEFEQPAWVSIEAWIPRNGRDVTKRRFASIKIEAKEFHRFKFEYTVELRDGDWKKTFSRLRDFNRAHAALIAEFALGRGREPALARLELRDRPLKFWKPKNRVNSLTVDVMSVTGRVLLAGGVVLLLLAAATTAVLVALGFVALIAGAALAIVARRRRAVVLSSGKPLAEPRSLVRVDSWQAMISGLGGDADRFRQHLLALMATPPMEGCMHHVEQIWYWGLDGKVEREQIVMTLRRGIIFCQIYPYDRELYVGWDAHLNSGQWVEKTVATGRSRTGEYTELRTVESGMQLLTEYDLIDVCCLSEWIHAQLVMLLKRLIKERQIDQEIDFKIIRGNRDDFNRDSGGGNSGEHRGTRSAAQRLGARLSRLG
jgi:hypothetical protein